jgi:hypothetical protein
MKRLVGILVFLQFSALAFGTSVPSKTLYPWDTACGIPGGGLFQYLDQSGAAKQRNTSAGSTVNIVTAGGDRTCTSDTWAVAQGAINASSSGQVIYFPVGAYKIGNTLSIFRKSVTLRGATWSGTFNTNTYTNCSWVPSDSTVSIVTSGTVSFHVPSSAGWLVGCGIVAQERQHPNNYMIGNVTAYSGSTVTISVTSGGGSGSITDWALSLSALVNANNTPIVKVGAVSGGQWYGSSVPTLESPSYVKFISGSPAQLATSLTVADTSGIHAGDLIQTMLRDEQDATRIAAGARPVIGLSSTGSDGGGGIGGSIHRQMNRIASISGTTVNLEVPLAWDYPAALVPRFVYEQQTTDETGIENLWLQGDYYDINCLVFEMANRCWAYNCRIVDSANYNFRMTNCFRCEVFRCDDGGRGHGGPSGAGLLGEQSSNNLIHNNSFVDIFPGMELQISWTCNAIAYNFCYGDQTRAVNSPAGNEYEFAYISTSHGPHNSHNLYEGNVSPTLKCDGYFGSSGEDLLAMNRFIGYIDANGVNRSGNAYITMDRFTWYYSTVGNIMGTPNVMNGAFSKGNPNIGNGNSIGATHPFSLGQWWIHFPNGHPVQATITNSATGAATLTDGSTIAAFDPAVFAGTPNIGMRWAADSGGRGSFTVTGTGASITISGGAGDALPANGTLVSFYFATYGYQEIDGGVDETHTTIGDLLVSGSGYSVTSLGGYTIPASYVYSGKPAWYDASLPFPFVDTAAPDFAEGLQPAWYRYLHGYDAPDTGYGGGPTVYTPTVRRIFKR